MCVMTFQVAYMTGLVITVGLTVVALSLPQWLQEINDQNDTVLNIGLFQKCSLIGSNDGEKLNCSKFWEFLDKAEKAGIVCLFLAVAICVIAFAWSVVAYYGCCLRGLLTEPLPYVTAIAFILHLAGLVCITYDRDIGEVEIEDGQRMGMSMFLSFAALAVLLITTLVSAGLSLSAKFCPC